ncbi:glycosyl hydrolase family 28 protein [Priestia aryabhattai]|uniref:glycosyl hydrolase family 28 protein n=1 Tax=Priestia aryabhattai TaxID=412384 RepID=UPI00234F757A|nr:glycosyl hydrolase family 28 protein [Priestia aryabhattai]MDC7762484.1 glycosyl hydrolase family 28 protein [Priestia aryabhattai]
MRYRPPSNRWDVQFEIDYEENLIDIDKDITGVDSKANNIQKQLDSMVLKAGDSSAAVAQSLIDNTGIAYGTLKGRLDAQGYYISIDAFPRIVPETNDQPRLQRFADLLSTTRQQGFVLSGEYTVNLPWLIDDNTSILLDPNAVIIRNFSGGGSSNATIRNRKMSTTNRNKNIFIQGGEIKAKDSAMVGKHLVFWGVDNLKIFDIKMREVYGDWSTLFRDCKVVFCTNIDIDTLAADIFTDGIHVVGGSEYIFTNCNIKSGDDCLSFTVETAEDTDIDGITIVNCNLTTRRSSVIKMTTKSGTTPTIKNILISIVKGKGGTTDAGEGIVIKDETNSGRISDIVLNDVKVDCSQGAGVGFRLQGINRVEGNVELIKPQGKGADITYCNDGDMKIRVDSPRTSGVSGISLGNVDDFDLIPIVINAPLHGVAVGGTNAPVTNTRIHKGKIKNAGNTAIRLINATGVDVLDNRLSGSGSGIVEDTGSNWNDIRGNDVRNITGTKVSRVGSETKARNNRGYKTYNAGTTGVPVGSTSVVVNHGLDTTPSAAGIFINPTNSMGSAMKWRVSNITATTFTLTLDQDPVGGIAQFMWTAQAPNNF